MSAEMVKARLNGLYDVVLPKHRADRPQWYAAEGWERARLAALRKEVIRQRDAGGEPVVYYVGAEEGEMAALCQMWGAKVVLFEPNQRVWANIKAIWEANDLGRPAGLFVGFASASTELTPPNDFDIEGRDVTEDGWPLCAHGPVISDHGFKELYQESDSIPQIKIDDMVASIGLPPTIISFDCEGSDWQVMRGAEQTVREHKPVIFASIHPEFMFHQFGEYSRDFRDWIIALGYDEIILDYQHELHTMYLPKAVV
jgi:FkbM family methyltransferase